MDWFSIRKKHTLVTAETALPDREQVLMPGHEHLIFERSMLPPYAADEHIVYLGMGCFWGAERRMWQQKGVSLTAVGYGGGITKNPTYEDVCSGKTAHVELVMVAYQPSVTSLETLLKVFWEAHDPTQGMRQGNDLGTQYRSAIYTTTDEQLRVAQLSCEAYQAGLTAAGYGVITTEIAPFTNFFFAEDYHQQYLHKNPNGYCGLRGTGVSCVL